MMVPFTKPSAKMRVAVGADPVGGVKLAFVVAIEGVGLLAMIEANGIGGAEFRSGAYLNPSLGVGLRLGGANPFVRRGWAAGSLTLDMERRDLSSAADGK